MNQIKREFSAGGVVFKKEKGRILWLAIQPNAEEEPWRRDRWQLPKGLIGEGETGQQAAVREVKEEGGVETEVFSKIDRINIFFHNEKKEKVSKNIVFFLMKYRAGSEKNHDQEVEEAVWLPYEEAYQRLTFDSEKKILEKGKKLLKEIERQPKLL